jgi:hypothetical protein
MVGDEIPAVSTTAASIWKHQGCAWWVIDWTQTYYLARVLVARPSLFCLVRSSCSYLIFVSESLSHVHHLISGIAIAGCTSLPELQDTSNNIHPDLYTNSVCDLVELLQK